LVTLPRRVKLSNLKFSKGWTILQSTKILSKSRIHIPAQIDKRLLSWYFFGAERSGFF
jgi:hypothetical protein